MSIVQGRTRAEWLELRREGIGGSDATALLGHSSYATPLSVWCDKVLPTEAVEDEAAEHLRWGNLLELPIAQAWAEQTGFRLVDLGRFTILGRDDLRWARATLDFLVVRPAEHGSTVTVSAVIQIKNVDVHLADEWGNTGRMELPDGIQLSDGRVPFAHYLQAQWELWVARGCGELIQDGWISRAPQWCGVVGLVGGNRMVSVTFAQDPDLVRLFESVGASFWDKVQRQEQPAAMADDRASLLRLYPESVPDLEIAIEDEEAPRMFERLQTARAAKTAAEREIKTVEQWFLQRVGDANRFTFAGRDKPVTCGTVRQPARMMSASTYRRFYWPNVPKAGASLREES